METLYGVITVQLFVMRLEDKDFQDSSQISREGLIFLGLTRDQELPMIIGMYMLKDLILLEFLNGLITAYPFVQHQGNKASPR